MEGGKTRKAARKEGEEGKNDGKADRNGSKKAKAKMAVLN